MYAVMKNGRLLSYQATARAAQRLADTAGLFNALYLSC